MYNKILLAVDGSENSVRATKEAVKMVSMNASCVVDVLYVADFAKAKQEVLHTQGKEELELVRRRKLWPVEEQLKQQNLSYQVHILHGDPGPMIVEYANKEVFDLVVIGSRGLNTFQEMVLGSVSHKVVKRVKAPVLVVK